MFQNELNNNCFSFKNQNSLKMSKKGGFANPNVINTIFVLFQSPFSMVFSIQSTVYSIVQFPGGVKTTIWRLPVPCTKKQGVSFDRFLGRTHAPRTSRLRCARTGVRTPNFKRSHFAPAPALQSFFINFSNFFQQFFSIFMV